MQFHEVVCISFLCLSSSQEFRSACLFLHLLRLLLSAQYLDVLGGEPDVLLGSRLQGGGGVGGVSEHDGVHLVPGVLLQRVQQAGDVEVGEVGEQRTVGNSDVCDETNLGNINILRCQETVAPKRREKCACVLNQISNSVKYLVVVDLFGSDRSSRSANLCSFVRLSVHSFLTCLKLSIFIFSSSFLHHDFIMTSG